jgi:hypothetical protein
VLLTIAFPVMLLINGVGNFGELINEYKRLYKQKKNGSFISDHVSSGTQKYEADKLEIS